ncbi:MAG: hypothetical protein ACOY4R_09435 [Pseudomonadota bacterium]
MNDEKRYYTADNPEAGVTPAELGKLSREDQLAYLEYWFYTYFEDPANETPYESAEGGYQYIWGGPYDARDELNDEFDGIVPEEVIEDAVKRVEQEGTIEWAPSRNHSDQQDAAAEAAAEQEDDVEQDLDYLIARLERGGTTSYGGPGDQQGREQIRADIAGIRETIRSEGPSGRIGHNNPPPDDEDVNDAFDTIGTEGEFIRAELDKPVPAALLVAKSASRLKAAWQYILKKLDVGVDTLVRTVAAGIGGSIVFQLSPQIKAFVHHVVQWLMIIASPF